MALVLANRVQETATPNTTVSFTLSGAVPGFQTFAIIGDTNTTYYAATDVTGNWEVGLGTYFTAGPTLDRTTIYESSNANNPVTFSGPVNVFVTYPSGRSINLDGSGNVSALGTISSGAWQGSTIGVAYGGTGVTSSSGPNSVMIRDNDQNVTVNRLNQSNTETLATGGSTLLTTASSYVQTLVGSGGHTYLLPDATTLTTGVAFVFNNMATGDLTIQNYATGSVGTIPAGGAGAVFLVFNGTVGGFWEVHSYLPEGVTFGTNAFNLGTSVISGGTWQGGTIQPAYGGTGLTTFAGPDNALYSTSFATLTAGTLPVAAGGTGLTSYTLNGVVYANTTTTLATSAALSFDGTSLYIGNDAYYNVKDPGGIDIRMLGISPTNVAYVGPSTSGPMSAIVNFAGTVAFTAFHASGSEVMRLNSTGLSIGITSSPYWVSSPGVGGPVRLVASNTDTNTAGFYYVSNDDIGPKIYLGKARGTGTTAVTFGDELGSVFFNGYDGSFLRPAARIEVEVDGSVASDQMPGRLMFFTSPGIGTANPFERMRIDSAGNVGIGTNTATAVSSILHVRAPDPILTIQDTETGFANTYAKIVTTGTGVGGGPRTDVQWMFGSTGNSFTFNYGTSSTERLRIDSAGNVGIGTSSPATNLVVQTTGNTEVRISTSNNAVGQTNTLRFSSTALGGAYAGGGAYIQSIQGSGVDIYDLAFGTALNSTAAAERMRLTASGNLGIGTTSPTNLLTVAGNANITGNTTLGDASTDTVQVNGYMGLGVAPNASLGLYVRSTALTGSAQYGIVTQPLGTSSAISQINGITSGANTSAAVFTVADLVQFRAQGNTKGSGSTITNLHGLYIEDQTQGTNNFGITSLVSSGTNKWNIYASGTAANYFAGTVGVGTNDTTYQLHTRVDDATTNAVTRALAVSHTTTSTAANGIGSGIAFQQESTTGSLRVSAYIDSIFTNATDASLASALTFTTRSGGSLTERARIDATGNVGIGTSSPGSLLQLNANNAELRLSEVNTYYGSIKIDSAGGLTIASDPSNVAANSRLIFDVDGTERARIDSSGNLGLGVTPSAWATGWRALQTVGGNSFYSDSSVSALASNAIYDGAWKYVNTAGAGTYQINRNAHNWFNAPSGTAGTAITFTTAMTLNASGNLGLGVTPSTWASSFKVMQLGAGGYVSGRTNTDEVYVGANAYFDTTDNRWEYIANDVATQYYQDAGNHVWRNAASGTANAPVNFTQTMTLDTSGRLLVGLTASNSSFAGKLQVEGTSDAFASLVRYSSTANSGPVFYFGRSKSATLGTNTIVAANDILGTIAFSGANGTNYRDAAYIQGFVDGTPGTGADMPGRLVFSTSPDGTATPSERMRITSVGQVILNSGFTRTNFAGNTTTPLLQIEGTTAATASTSIVRGAADAIGPTFNLGKTRGLVSGNTIVASGDQLGIINFQGADGANLLAAASIQAVVDGTPGSVDMPGRLVFSTAADNESFPTERARIDSAGNVQVLTGANVVWAPEPAAINTTATLTNANIQAQIISTTGTSYTVTMPLGTTLETLVTWAAVNLGYDFTVINTASGTITMAVNTGVTSLGALTIATGTSAQFRIRRTAANTFVLYRMF